MALLCLLRWHRSVRGKTLVAAGQCTPVNPAVSTATRVCLVRCDGGSVRRCTPATCSGATPSRCSDVVGRRRRDRGGQARRGVDDRGDRPRSSEGVVGEGFRRRRHTVDASKDDAVEAVKAATGGLGADVLHRGRRPPQGARAGFFARDLAGTVVQVGVPPDDALPRHPMIEFFGRGGALKPSWYGDCLPSRDFRCSSTCTCRPAAAREVRLETIGLAESRRRFTGWSAVRSCVPWWCSSDCQATCLADVLRLRRGSLKALGARPSSTQAD